jgi:hypothetical protein
MTAPKLVFSDLHDERYRFDRYWEQLSSIDVPTPRTRIISFESVDDGIPECPTDEIREFMDEENLNQAFLRSGFKAAIDRFKDGSIIHKKTDEQIESTFESLIRQHIMNDVPHGNRLIVRERLRLQFCMEQNHSHRPEIRYFIQNGEIIAKTPRPDVVDPVPDCPVAYDYVKENLNEVSTPDNIALTVADGFKESEYPWSVDIVMDTNGEWWVTEMHIDGVYYNHHKDQWWNVCGHGDAVENSPKWVHESALRNNIPEQK